MSCYPYGDPLVCYFLFFPLLLLIFVLCVWSSLIWLICVGVFHLGFILFGTLWVSWTWVAISFFILGKFSTIISSSIFSWPFFLPSSSGTFECWCVYHCPRGLWGCPHLILSFFLSASFISTILLPHLSYFLPQLFYCWFPPECFWSKLLHYSLLTIFYFF